MEQIKLSSEDREFFSLVSQASSANPFGPVRLELDKKISGKASKASWVKIRPEAINEIAGRVAKIDEDRLAKISDFHKSDQELIERVFLFEVYHKFNLDFDKLIDEQVAKGDASVAVPFAKRAISLLRQRGFSDESANQYFSLFFQMRRAFYFIENNLIGQCPSMQDLRMNLWNNIFTYDIIHYKDYLLDRMEDFSTLLLGPTGCGKGAAAASIGRSGFIPFDEKKQSFTESFTETFVPINLSQYSQSLIESELFGHTKGAFTGAVTSHDGVFAMCRPHGSIFLDEIGEISTQIQIKLLQVLQERIFSPVGSHDTLSFRGRVVAATNRSIDKLREEHKFRDDFYYRLCSDCIVVPSLQERIRENRNELAELVGITVKRIVGKESATLVGTVLEVIGKTLPDDYAWPGNVRELAQCVRRVMIKRNYQSDNCCGAVGGDSQLLSDIAAGTISAEDLLGRYCKMLYKKFGTYEQVSQKTRLDRRTVKKYIDKAE